MYFGIIDTRLYSFKENSLPYKIPKFVVNQADIEQETSKQVVIKLQ